MKRISVRTCTVLMLITFLFASCERKTLVEEVLDMVDRCYEFIGTSHFPGRSLAWVRNASNPTYYDRRTSLSVEYFGAETGQPTCIISNKMGNWNSEQQDVVFTQVLIDFQRYAKKIQISDRNIEFQRTTVGKKRINPNLGKCISSNIFMEKIGPSGIEIRMISEMC